MDDPFIRALSSAIWICNGFARRLDTLWIRYGVCYREGWRDIYREEEKGKMTQCLWKLIIIEILCIKKGYICYIW